MSKTPKPYEILLKIKKIIPEEVENLNKVLKVFQKNENKKLLESFIAAYDFSDNKPDTSEVLILSVMFDEYIEGRANHITAVSSITEITKDKNEVIGLFDKIKALIDKNIIFVENTIPEYSNIKKQPLTNHFIIDNDCTLNSHFIDWVFDEDSGAFTDLDKPYISNDEFIYDWCLYLQKQKEVYIDRNRSLITEDLQLTNAETLSLLEADRIKERIEKKLKITKTEIPFLKITDKYKLNKIEQKIVMYLVREAMTDSNDTDTGDILKMISTNQKELYTNRKYIDKDSKLIKKKIVFQSERYVLSRYNEFNLSQDIFDKILELKPSTEEDRLTEILKNNEIFTLLEPNQTFDDLILAKETKEILRTGLSYYNKHVNRTIEDWGLFDKGTHEVGKNGTKNDMGLLMLFYGDPGTGKTFAAGALAHRLGKKLLITDVSKIKSAWVGASEKNVQQMFDIFDEIVNTTTNPPIILMNEADQFLHKRMTNVDRAVDQMYNAVQNLFLEAFEKLKGILIATTNMHENLDPAFSRRFHLKIEFPTPDFEQRRQLWNLHITDSIPIANDINIDELAYKYKLSGGQIKVIVRNACVQAASREKNERILTQADLEKYCELEDSSELYQKERNIGFRSENNEN